MLILTRKIGEKIRINKNIEVVVLGHRSNQVKIGINAPENVTIRRSELPIIYKENK